MDIEQWQVIDQNNRHVWQASMLRVLHEQRENYNLLVFDVAEATRLPHPIGTMVLDAYRAAGCGLFVNALIEGAN